MKSGRFAHLRALAVTLAVFAVLFTGAIMLLNYIGECSDEAQADMVRDAIRNAVLTCYAVEGAYPERLQYLVDNYGLQFDADRFLITYDAFASNIFPDIRVNVKGGE